MVHRRRSAARLTVYAGIALVLWIVDGAAMASIRQSQNGVVWNLAVTLFIALFVTWSGLLATAFVRGATSAVRSLGRRRTPHAP